MRWLRRVWYWLHFRARQEDLRDELALHHDMRAAELERGGLSPNDAQAAARRAMGNATYMREGAREVWLPVALDALITDVRQAWRGLRRAPGFSSVVLLTVAFAIAANAAIFSVVHHLLLAPLPYPEGNEIVALEGVVVNAPDMPLGVPKAAWDSWRARSHTLGDFAAARAGVFRLAAEDAHDTVPGASITPSFMAMLRVHPVLGRGFTTEDVERGAAPVAMIGYALWHGRYSGATDVVGTVVRVNGILRTIVGVGPVHMDIPMSENDWPEIWLPLNPDSIGGDADEYRFARLRGGTTVEAASRELQLLMAGVADTIWRARVTRARDLVEPNEQRAIRVLFVAVAALLLTACANIANLLLGRSWARRRELATRLALGAGRWRIARSALAESVMLALIGGALGLLIAWRGLHTIILLRPPSLSDLDGVRIEWPVLWWSAAIAAASGLLFGTAPAMLAGGPSVSESLRVGAHATSSRAVRRVRGALLVAEVGLSVVFLVAAGLLLRSFVALENTPIGFDPAGLMAADIQFAHKPAATDRDAVYRTLVQSVAAIPGVTRVAAGGLPGALLRTDVRGGPFAVEGPSGPVEQELPFCEMPFVGPGYFRAIGLPLLQGRGFDAENGIDVSHAVVVNRALARRFWPGGDALGSRLRVGDGPGATWLTVVGIAGDVHAPGLANGDLFTLQMYRPVSLYDEPASFIVFRTGLDTHSTTLAPSVRRAIERAGVSASVTSLESAESVFDRRVVARPRFALVLFGVFAAVAVALAGVGLYAVVAYEVVQRTQEIGIRIALGAAPRAAARLAVAMNARFVAIGGCIGLGVAYLGAKAMASLLYGVSATDPLAFVAAMACLFLVALAASLIPAWRAARINPVIALRVD